MQEYDISYRAMQVIRSLAMKGVPWARARIFGVVGPYAQVWTPREMFQAIRRRHPERFPTHFVSAI